MYPLMYKEAYLLKGILNYNYLLAFILCINNEIELNVIEIEILIC
ncbi:hypothetical protein [Clostridium perfringens]|nr:hypothetical protein [Clostridium perfringens]